LERLRLMKRIIAPLFLMLLLAPAWGCAELIEVIDFSAGLHDTLTGREAKEEAREDKKREDKKLKKDRAKEKNRQEAEEARQERELADKMAQCLDIHKNQSLCDLIHR